MGAAFDSRRGARHRQRRRAQGRTLGELKLNAARSDANEGWADLSGRLSAEGHRLPVRVYFEDTDFSGAVYHTSYLRWCERGRSDFLRLLGIAHSELAAGAIAEIPCAFAIRRIEADYLAPARIDEVLEVRTSLASLSKASITLDQAISRGARILFKLRAQCVLVSFDGRLLRLPTDVLTKLPKTTTAANA